MDVVSIAPEMAIRIEDLSYAYPDGTVALRDVSLFVRRGESVALMGPNGAGKSTLLLHLNGILTGQGRVEIMGVEINRKNMRRVRDMVGLVFQDPDDQLFSPTVKDDVSFGPLNQRLPADQVRQAVSAALEAVGMEGSEERSPHHMSFGEKKRVSLATVLAMQPEILVLDEPVANLDPRGRRHFLGLIKERHSTKVVVTHDIDMAREVCDRVVVMDGGRIVADGSPRDIFSDARLLERHGLA